MSRLRIFLFSAWLVVAILFTQGLCFGEPFLVSDPYAKTKDQPMRFSVVAGKLKFTVPAEKLSDGTVRLRFDLGKLPDGEHNIEIKAVNDSAQRESEPVSMQILKKNGEVLTLTAPQGKLEKEKIPPSRAIPGLTRP
jgi:hypothetical protein